MSDSVGRADATPSTALEAGGIEHVDVEALEEWPKGVDEPALVVFVAPWCEVCLEAAPALLEFAGKLDGRTTLRQVDTDRHPQAVERMNVRSVPTLVLFARDREISRRTEISTAEELSGFLDRALKDVPPPEVKKKDEKADAKTDEGAGGDADEKVPATDGDQGKKE